MKATNETQHRQEQQCQAVSVGSNRKFNSSSSNTKVEATASEKPQSATALQKPLDKRKAGQEVKKEDWSDKKRKKPKTKSNNSTTTSQTRSIDSDSNGRNCATRRTKTGAIARASVRTTHNRAKHRNSSDSDRSVRASEKLVIIRVNSHTCIHTYDTIYIYIYYIIIPVRI